MATEKKEEELVSVTFQITYITKDDPKWIEAAKQVIRDQLADRAYMETNEFEIEKVRDPEATVEEFLIDLLEDEDDEV